MLLFKNLDFPLSKYLSPPLLLPGTMYVYVLCHLSYMSFEWQDVFYFCVLKMPSTPGDHPSGNS